MLNIVVERGLSDASCTPGEMFTNGIHECFTLEPPVRTGTKIPGHTAIPAGTYDIALYSSPRHGYIVPLLLRVPNFKFVEIHPGNAATDTEACILVGEEWQKDLILQSRIAFSCLMVKIQAALGSGQPVQIRIEDAPTASDSTQPLAS